MAARRNNRGRRRSRGRFGFLYKLLSIVAILAAVIVGCVVFFRVNQIEIQGQSKYSAEEIIAAAEVERGDNLFTLDKFRMSRQILTRLPYVDEVAISRRLPDTLVIRVTECTPMACIQGEGAWWVLDERTKLLERTDTAGAEGYPRVTGLTPTAPTVGTKLSVGEEQAHKLESLAKLMRALADEHAAGRVESYDFTASNHILLGYDGRFTVKIPLSVEDFGTTVRTMVQAAALVDPNATGVLDLTLSETQVHLIPYGS